MDIFKENRKLFRPREMRRIAASSVLIVGMGGLGGHVANGLVRLGVGRLVFVDDDVFETKNLNRQLFADRETIGQNKARTVRDALARVNPDAQLEVCQCRIEELPASVLQTVDLIVDAVDNIPTKRYLETLGQRHEKPLLHAAIGGWLGQLGVILPGRPLLDTVYGNLEEGVEGCDGNPTFTPAVIGSLMVVEAAKLLAGQESVLADRLLYVDLYRQAYDWLEEFTVDADGMSENKEE